LVAILEAMGSNNVEKTAEQAVRPRQETVEESLERLEHRLDEMGRERGEP